MLYKSCGCMYGACDCGGSSQPESVLTRRARSRIKAVANNLSYKGVFKDPEDKRKRVTRSLSSSNSCHWDKLFVHNVDIISVSETISRIKYVHKHCKHLKGYKPEMLKSGVANLMESHSREDRDLIDQHFKEFFEYTVVKTHWKRL